MRRTLDLRASLNARVRRQPRPAHCRTITCRIINKGFTVSLGRRQDGDRRHPHASFNVRTGRSICKTNTESRAQGAGSTCVFHIRGAPRGWGAQLQNLCQRCNRPFRTATDRRAPAHAYSPQTGNFRAGRRGKRRLLQECIVVWRAEMLRRASRGPSVSSGAVKMCA